MEKVVFKMGDGDGPGPGVGEGSGGAGNNNEATEVVGESGQVYVNVPADTSIEKGGADVLIPA